jgi:hypothetical protein
MDLGGIQGVFHHKRVSFVQAQPPVPDRLASSAISIASSTVPSTIPSTILVWPGSFGPSLTLQSNAFTHKTAATGDPLRPNCTHSCFHLDCERSPIKPGLLHNILPVKNFMILHRSDGRPWVLKRSTDPRDPRLSHNYTHPIHIAGKYA